MTDPSRPSRTGAEIPSAPADLLACCTCPIAIIKFSFLLFRELDRWRSELLCHVPVNRHAASIGRPVLDEQPRSQEHVFADSIYDHCVVIFGELAPVGIENEAVGVVPIQLHAEVVVGIRCDGKDVCADIDYRSGSAVLVSHEGKPGVIGSVVHPAHTVRGIEGWSSLGIHRTRICAREHVRKHDLELTGGNGVDAEEGYIQGFAVTTVVPSSASTPLPPVSSRSC